MKTAQFDEDVRLTNKELRFLLRSMYSKYAVYVFKISRAKELGGYAPVFEESESAYKDLCALLACEEIAEQVLENSTQIKQSFHLNAFQHALINERG